MTDVDIECPICKSPPINARIYDMCGHTVCTSCMIRNDVADELSAPLHNLAAYKCPICRSGTFQAWYDRPHNHIINQIMETRPGHAELTAQINGELNAWIEDQGADVDMEQHKAPVGALRKPDCLGVEDVSNLPQMASHVRRVRAAVLFRRLMPTVIHAAANGCQCLCITTRARELSLFVDELSSMMYPYGIYSVIATPREFTIHIVQPTDVSHWSNERCNPDYIPPV